MHFKKLAAAAVSSLMILSMSIPVFAADLNSSESSVLSTLSDCKVPAEYINQAKNYFLLDDVDITSDQADIINSHIRTAKEKAGNASSISALTSEQQREVVNEMASAASAIGLGVTYDSSSKTLLVTKDGTIVLESVGGTITSGVKNGSSSGSTTINNTTNNNTTNNTTNNNSGTSNGVIKQTGTNMYVTYGVVGALVVVLAGCSIIIFKKNSFKKEA